MVHEVEALVARPAVQAAFDRRGAQIVAASTGSHGGWRPLQRDVVLRAACSPHVRMEGPLDRPELDLDLRQCAVTDKESRAAEVLGLVRAHGGGMVFVQTVAAARAA